MGCEYDQNFMFLYNFTEAKYDKTLAQHPKCMTTVLLQWIQYMLWEGRGLCKQVTICDWLRAGLEVFEGVCIHRVNW